MIFPCEVGWVVECVNFCVAEWIFASFSGPVPRCLLLIGLETFSLAFTLSLARAPSFAVS